MATTRANKQLLEGQERFMQLAVDQSQYAVDSGRGGPFGAIIVKAGKLVGSAGNSVMANCDPTAHAEVSAIRDACKNLKTIDLSGCEMYSSAEPCPMCAAAVYWSQLDAVYFANTEKEAMDYGFVDKDILDELKLPNEKRELVFKRIKNDLAIKVFDRYVQK